MKFLICITLCILLRYTEAACYNGSGLALCSTCGGSFTFGVGVMCADGSPCVPDNSVTCPYETNDCCSLLTGYYWDISLQCCSDVKTCNPQCNEDEYCNIDGTPYCACDLSQVTITKRTDLNPGVTCADGTMITDVSKCYLQKLGYDYKTLHLANESSECKITYSAVVDNIDVWKLQVKAAIGWCGNRVEEDSGKIYFTNTIYIDPYPGPLIIKNPISYNMTCVYNLTMETSLGFALNPTVSTNTIPAINGNGNFTVTMAAFRNQDCTNAIEQNQDVAVGTLICIGVFSPDADGDLLALEAESCIATPTNNRNDQNYVQLVSGGAAAPGNVQVKVQQNGVSLDDQILINTFQFPGYTKVFIFCDVAFCNKTSGCNGVKSNRATTTGTTLGIGINLKADYFFSSSGHQIAASWTLLAVLLLTFLTTKLF